MNKCLIIANGKPPDISVIEYFKKEGYSTIYCADGGSNSAKKLGIIPDYIIGDFDSITEETKLFFQNKSELIHIKSQNDTDVEKCIKHAVKNGIQEAILTGVTGDRLDHTLCNMSIVIKYFYQIKIKIAAEKSLLIPKTDLCKFITIPGEQVSLFGFNKRTKIISKGLKYKLDNIPLPFGEKESTSNVATDISVILLIKGGIIFIIRDLETIIKHDIFRFS